MHSYCSVSFHTSVLKKSSGLCCHSTSIWNSNKRWCLSSGVEHVTWIQSD